PVATGGSMAMRLDFESARTATALLVDGTVVPLVNLAFGTDYVETPFDAHDEAYGTLVLPDLEGTWAMPAWVPDIVTFGPAVEDDGTIVFFQTPSEDNAGETVVQCSAATAERPAGCTITNHCCSPPVRAFAPLGDLGEDRLRFQFQGSGESFHAVRIPQDGVESTARLLPAEGFWTIPGKSGTGMHFQHRGELLAVSQFDFVDEESHWRLGVA